jgi:DNA-binding winged helix-turn-helix (wHTH) protein
MVSKDLLMKELWPDAFVEEANLSQNIFMLRTALATRRKPDATCRHFVRVSR